LFAILFPVAAQVREKARQITCSSDLNQIQYQQDNDARMNARSDGEDSLSSSWLADHEIVAAPEMPLAWKRRIARLSSGNAPIRR